MLKKKGKTKKSRNIRRRVRKLIATHTHDNKKNKKREQNKIRKTQ